MQTHEHVREHELGDLLRYWRHERGKSQLDLSLDTGISQRHLSFVESGRSVPSRDLLCLSRIRWRYCGSKDTGTAKKARKVSRREDSKHKRPAGYSVVIPRQDLPAIQELTVPTGGEYGSKQGRLLESA
jgi:transcriptional regulator with XRE-family HTH domain